jgi:HSP20 family protein
MSKFPKLKSYYEHPLTNLKNDFDNLFGLLLSDEANLLAKMTDYGDFMLKMNVSETDKEYQLHFEVPGMNKEDLEVSLNQNTLSVKGERKHEKTEDTKQFHRIESQYGTFYREIKLPPNTDEQSLKANFKNGVLMITINKTMMAPGNKRTIPISE